MGLQTPSLKFDKAGRMENPLTTLWVLGLASGFEPCHRIKIQRLFGCWEFVEQPGTLLGRRG